MPLGRCELCAREGVEVTRHHLIPRTRHSNKRNRKLFNREDVLTRLADLCRPCHGFVHKVLTEKQLELHYNTVDSLRSHPDVARFVEWLKNKPPGLRVRSHRPV
jgi:uncharacterized protein with von Willebrand factor type A (vWA) domain